MVESTVMKIKIFLVLLIYCRFYRVVIIELCDVHWLSFLRNKEPARSEDILLTKKLGLWP